ncbi:MAG TPA: VOC family protein, partial [Paracoccaceae bacterium]
MSFTPYIHFDGTCEKAMTFYAQVFGGTDLQLMRYTDAPEGSGMPASDRIMHSQFNANGGALMASDFPPGMGGEPQAALSVMVAPATVAEAKRINDTLGQGGSVIMP